MLLTTQDASHSFPILPLMNGLELNDANTLLRTDSHKRTNNRVIADIYNASDCYLTTDSNKCAKRGQ